MSILLNLLNQHTALSQKPKGIDDDKLLSF